MEPTRVSPLGGEVIGKIITGIFPLGTTVVLFLVFYNNWLGGRWILLGLILLNLAAFAVLSTQFSFLRRFLWSRPAYLWLACILGAVLAVEAAFPIFWPKEYVGIRELTKGFSAPTATGAHPEKLVFTNQDQRLTHIPKSVKTADISKRSWHSPGKEYTYYGYEPNSGIKYVNLFHWNSEGYYDHDYSHSRSKGERRIVIIGDSYVEALQVPLSRSFHKLIEATLNSHSSDGPKERDEVIALGQSGTGQVENFKVLRNKALLYQPDIVVMTLASNDFCDDDPGLNREMALAMGAVTPLVRGLAGHGYFASALAIRRIDDLLRRRITICPEFLQWAEAEIPRVEAAWKRTLDMILASRDFCRSNGTMFILVYLGSDLEVKHALDPDGTVARIKYMGPAYASISWDLDRSIQRVTDFCERNDIPVISMLEPLVEAQKATGQFVFGDHYTMFGHRVVAQVLGCALGASLAVRDGDRPSFKGCLAPESWKSLAAVTALLSAEGTVVANPVPASGSFGQAH